MPFSLQYKFLAIYLCLIFSCISSVCGQSYSTGLIDNEEVEKKYDELDALPTPGSEQIEDLIAQISKVDLSIYAPTPLDQGNLNSCVGWASSNALTISFGKELKWSKESINSNALSALYIYNPIKIGTCENDLGSSISTAGEFLIKNGDAKRIDFDLPDVENCRRSPNRKEKIEAKQFKIKEFYKVFNFDSESREKISKTKFSLIDSIPVIIGIELLENFKNPQGQFWDPELGDKSYVSGHAMCVVGFDDVKKAFKLLNSWGPDWANNGFIWVKYTDFARHVKYGYQFHIETKAPIPNLKKDLQAICSFELIDYDLEDNPIFMEATVKHQGNGTYFINKNKWEIEDKFRLVLKDLPQNSYLYVFSKDAKGVYVHYPRGISYDTLKAAYSPGDGSLIYRNNNVIVPDPETVLERRADGDDNLCIIVSATNIENFKAKMHVLRSNTDEFEIAVRKIFESNFFDSNSIDFEDTKIGFKNTKIDHSKAAPIFLTLTNND